MNSFAFVLASFCLVQAAFSWVVEPGCGAGPFGYGADVMAPGAYAYGAGPFTGPLSAPLIDAPFAGPYGGAYGPYAGPYGAPLAGPFESIGAYGGEGIGDVAVAGEMPVAGTTLVAGQVPILGAVRFAGDLPAGGVVTIAGSCGCGCNRSPYVY